jgi:hypothetical protein
MARGPFAPTRVQLATSPVLITKTNSTRAIAVESTNLVAEPFGLTAPVTFGQDNRTRVILFADNLTLQSGDTFSAVTAEAEDVNHIHYPLTVVRRHCSRLFMDDGCHRAFERQPW